MNEFPAPPPEVVEKLEQLNGWRNKRQQMYGQIGSQLDLLFDDIEAGLFGEQAKTGKWYNHIKSVKSNIEKPDVKAIQAELDRLIS